MQSARSFFNRTVFSKTVKRYWPMWALYLLVWTLVMCIGVQSSILPYRDSAYLSENLLELCWQFGLISSFISCCISAMLVHSWMYNARSASAYSAMPVSRLSMFISVSLAGIVPLLACNLIASLAAFLLGLFNNVFILSTVVNCFLVVSLECIFLYGLATFCAVLTGHVFVLPAIYAIFNFLSVVVESLVRLMMSQFTFGATYTDSSLDFLSPVFYLINNTRVSCKGMSGAATFSSWWPFIIYAAIGVILIVFGAFIFRKRKMESASDVVAVKPLKPVFKYCMCFGCALVLGILFFTLIFDAFFSTGDPFASVLMCICMIVGGFIGYYSAEMLIRKSFKVFRRTWRGFLVSCALIILFITAVETDLFGYERRIPELDSIKSARIDMYGQPSYFTTEEEIRQLVLLHERIINNKDETEKNLYRYYSDYMTTDYSNAFNYRLYLTYELTNGRTLERSYQFIYHADKFSDDLMDALNQPNIILSRITDDFDSQYIETAYINVDYTVPSNTYIGQDEDVYDFFTISTFEGDLPIDVSKYDGGESVNSGLQLTAQQARAFFEGAVFEDAKEGNICRIMHDYPRYKDKISINVEFSVRIPLDINDPDSVDGYRYQYLYIHDINEDSQHTVAALKDLGIDLDALATSAIKW